MTRNELIKILMDFPDLDIHIDVDDFTMLNIREVKHIYHARVNGEEILVIDADWGDRRPSGIEILKEITHAYPC